MKRKLLITLLSVVLVFSAFAGCGSKDVAEVPEVELPHYDQMTKDKEYNKNLFYNNDLIVKAADPSVIYVTDGAEAGYFYMYATSDEIGASGYQSWRSKDLVNWECMGVAFVPDRNSWAKQNYWAPEVIYYKANASETGKYYMFYNAWNVNKDYLHCAGLAVSDNPYGPFVQFTGKSGDRDVKISDAYLDTSLFPAGSAVRNAPVIDMSPFVDTDGKIYLYFTLDIQRGAENSSIWGMRLTDMFTPDYSSVKQITEFGKTTVGGETNIAETNRTNEAPFMIKNNGKYYMTYSISQYFNPAYSAAQAISNDPLQNFEKVSFDKGGKFLTYQGNNGEENYDHMSGTGHHSFARVGDEIFAIYHAFVDRAGTIAEGRSIAADRISFVSNGEQEIIYANGPSYSLQALPTAVSGYKNLIKDATVTATNVVDGFGTEFLKDGMYKNHNYDFIKEFKASGDTVITIKFSKEVNVSAIMVYNSFDIETAFTKVNKISMPTKIDGNSVLAIINDLKFDAEKHIFVDKNDADFKLMRPGGASIAEFNAVKTNEIAITMNSKTPICISDIVVLGKEA